MNYLEAILKVLAVGLILGAGLPAVFAIGLVAFSKGSGGVGNDGTTTAPNPALKFAGLLLFTLVAAVVCLPISTGLAVLFHRASALLVTRLPQRSPRPA